MPSIFSILSVTPVLAARQGFRPYSEYDPHLHIIVEVEIWNGKEWIKTFVMIDSGCSENVIDSRFVQYLGVPSSTKAVPLHLKLADGTLNPSGIVTDEITTQLRITKHQEAISFDVTKIESYPIMLGIPWLKCHDPGIHWSRHEITFNSPFCLSSCCLDEPLTITALEKYPFLDDPVHLDHPREISPPDPREEDPNPDSSREARAMPPLDIRCKPKSQLRSRSKNQPKSRSKRHKGQPSPPPKPQPKEPRSLPRAPPKVSTVSGAAFSTYYRRSDIQIYQLSVRELLESEERETDQLDPDLSKIPPEYHKFAKVFSKEEADKLPEHRPYDHKIPLKPDTTPPWGPIYSLSPEELKVLREYIHEHLRKGFIQHSQSPCAAPILFAKKPDGTLRLCVDYRGLNQITIRNRYPLPLINELFDRVRGTKYFTKFDVRDGYHRLRMAKGEEWKTAFHTRYGLFEYCVMPFGLCNAPGTFQHHMNNTFRDYLDDFLANYMDDLLVYSKTLKEHKIHVRKVLQRLQEKELYLKPSKCEFHKSEVKFLGYIISENSISMDPTKVETVLSWLAPQSVLEIQTFLGLANFYRRFIKNFSRLLVPITALLKKNTPFHWNRAADRAFRALKKAFTSAPVLRHFDYSKPAVMETDASDYAIGAILSQLDEDTGLLHPCAFFSRKFTPAELNYEIYDKEMLAVVDGFSTWRHYLEGSGHQTQVITDHKNLIWFSETKVYN